MLVYFANLIGQPFGLKYSDLITSHQQLATEIIGGADFESEYAAVFTRVYLFLIFVMRVIAETVHISAVYLNLYRLGLSVTQGRYLVALLVFAIFDR